MANRMTPPAEGQEKDVLLVLDKQQGKEPLKQDQDKPEAIATLRRERMPGSFP